MAPKKEDYFFLSRLSAAAASKTLKPLTFALCLKLKDGVKVSAGLETMTEKKKSKNVKLVCQLNRTDGPKAFSIYLAEES